jgi:hypothetical protein
MLMDGESSEIAAVVVDYRAEVVDRSTVTSSRRGNLECVENGFGHGVFPVVSLVVALKGNLGMCHREGATTFTATAGDRAEGAAGEGAEGPAAGEGAVLLPVKVPPRFTATAGDCQ